MEEQFGKKFESEMIRCLTDVFSQRCCNQKHRFNFLNNINVSDSSQEKVLKGHQEFVKAPQKSDKEKGTDCFIFGIPIDFTINPCKKFVKFEKNATIIIPNKQIKITFGIRETNSYLDITNKKFSPVLVMLFKPFNTIKNNLGIVIESVKSKIDDIIFSSIMFYTEKIRQNINSIIIVLHPQNHFINHAVADKVFLKPIGSEKSKTLIIYGLNPSTETLCKYYSDISRKYTFAIVVVNDNQDRKMTFANNELQECIKSGKETEIQARQFLLNQINQNPSLQSNN